jgi:hypothetical protein
LLLRAFVTALLVGLLAGPAFAAPPSIVGAVSPGNSVVSSDTLSVPHTVLAGNGNRMLVVLSSIKADLAVLSLTYGGVPLTRVEGGYITAAGAAAATYYLLDPTPGTANVVLTIAAASTAPKALVALTLQDALQVTPTYAAAASRNNANAISNTIVTEVADTLLIDSLTISGPGHDPTPTGGAQELADQAVSGAGMRQAVAARVQAVAGSATAGWTQPVTASWLLHTLVGIKPFSPPPPTGTGRLTLNWIDNSNNEDGFAIEYHSMETEGTGVFAELTRVPANTQTFAHINLVIGAEYCYRVRAFNTAGNSDYTNTACARPQVPATVPAAPSELTVTDSTVAP